MFVKTKTLFEESRTRTRLLMYPYDIFGRVKVTEKWLFLAIDLFSYDMFLSYIVSLLLQLEFSFWKRQHIYDSSKEGYKSHSHATSFENSNRKVLFASFRCWSKLVIHARCARSQESVYTFVKWFRWDTIAYTDIKTLTPLAVSALS